MMTDHHLSEPDEDLATTTKMHIQESNMPPGLSIGMFLFVVIFFFACSLYHPFPLFPLNPAL